jgi:pimeloyl-ACP methyl ester carboxylesterase
MAELTTALSTLPAARDWNFWDISYDAQRTTFPRSARHIAAALREQPFDFERIIIFGYSMGGLVARSMIAEGLECEALVTICTPHQGLVPWWLPLGRGLRSMAPRSSMLRALNANARDRAQRHNYHFFAAAYTDILGFHNHDGVVPLASALGEELGPVAERDTVHLHYSSVATFDPHWRCKHPRYIAPVLETATRLFGGEPRQIVLPPGTAEPAVCGKS